MFYELMLIKNAYGGYEDVNCKQIESWFLYLFLTSDVSHSYKIYLDLAYDKLFHGGVGNAICMEKENGYIYLSDGIVFPAEGEKTLRFRIPLQEYINLIITWGTKIFTEDQSKRPSEVRIRYKNEKFYFDIKQ